MKRFQSFLLNYQLRDLRLELIFPKALLTTYYLKLTFQFLNASACHLTQFLRKSLGQKLSDRYSKLSSKVIFNNNLKLHRYTESATV